MLPITIPYENQGMIYQSSTEFKGMWILTFYAQTDITIRTDIVQLIPLRMTFDIKELRGYILAPMYLGQSLNVGSNLVMRNNEVYVALLEYRLSESKKKYDEVVYIRAGEPLVAIHTLDPIVFEERI